MRIGIDIRTLMDEKYSGIPEYSSSLINEMFRKDRENEYILFYNSFKDLSERIGKFDYDNVKVVKTSFPSKVFSYLMQKILKYPKLDRLLDVDVFFMPHLNFAAFSGQAKTIITVHDLSFLAYPEFFSFKKNVWHKMLNVNQSLLKFDKIIAISENTKQDLVEFCGIDQDKISTVFSGIGEQFRVISKDDIILKEVKEKYNLPDRFILYLGTIEPRKNVDSLILAYDKLMDENPEFKDVYLVIAGARGWKYRQTIRIFENSNHKDKIIFSGYVDKEDKAGIYNLAEVFVYPSFYEGFGFPPLEAMACGVPCIVSANSSLSEVLGSAAMFIDPYDSNSIKIAMGELLNVTSLRDRLRAEGLNVAKKYDWKTTALKTLEIIESLS